MTIWILRVKCATCGRWYGGSNRGLIDAADPSKGDRVVPNTHRQDGQKSPVCLGSYLQVKQIKRHRE